MPTYTIAGKTVLITAPPEASVRPPPARCRHAEPRPRPRRRIGPRPPARRRPGTGPDGGCHRHRRTRRTAARRRGARWHVLVTASVYAYRHRTARRSHRRPKAPHLDRQGPRLVPHPDRRAPRVPRPVHPLRHRPGLGGRMAQPRRTRPTSHEPGPIPRDLCRWQLRRPPGGRTPQLFDLRVRKSSVTDKIKSLGHRPGPRESDRYVSVWSLTGRVVVVRSYGVVRAGGVLSDKQAAAFGRYGGSVPLAELERFFYLDDTDRKLVAGQREDHNRLGLSVQLVTVRYISASFWRIRWMGSRPRSSRRYVQ